MPQSTSAAAIDIVTRVRRAGRRWLPYRLRARVAVARRCLRDRRRRVDFARRRGDPAAFPHRFSGYQLPFIIYAGQEQYAAAKRHNQRLMASALHCLRVDPGQVFSLWRCAGRPRARRGYLPGVVLVDGRIAMDEGGSTCLLSTVLYNAGLLAGLDVVERHAHSTDVYGESRYYELGRDATILYGVLDLRFRNPYPFPVLLDVTVDDARVAAVFRAPVPDLPAVEITVAGHGDEDRERATAASPRLLRVGALRTITPPGGAPRTESVGWSEYRIPGATAGPAGEDRRAGRG
ncbi:MAG: VanW family protein [Chloroflexi bacterium]|nr:VanW family protein [Chloroflexota bacterium]